MISGEMVDRTRERIASRGTMITCPGCSALIAKLTEDLFFGDKVWAECFDWAPGFEVANGQRLACRSCNSAFGRASGGIPQLHTAEKGWVPYGSRCT